MRLAEIKKEIYLVPVWGRRWGVVAAVSRIDAGIAAAYQWSRHVNSSGNVSPVTMINRKRVFLRRLICANAHGPAPSEDYVVEHINGDTLDCQRDNLRWVHKTQTRYAKHKFATTTVTG